MRYYKVDQNEVDDLELKTESATMFDLKAYITANSVIKAFNPHQKEMSLPVREKNGEFYFSLQPQFRAVVSTGIAFSIPVKYQLRVTPNKELALKSGVVLLGGTEIYDNDYVDEVKVTLYNTCDTPVFIHANEVIAQATLNKVLEFTLEPTDRKVAIKTPKTKSKDVENVNDKDDSEETAEE